MEFLFDKKQSNLIEELEDFKVNKTNFIIRKKAFTTILRGYDLKSTYCNIGINEEGNLCLYLKNSSHPRMFKAYVQKYNGVVTNLRTQIGRKEHQKELAKFVGGYQVLRIINISGNIKEVVLGKL